MKICHLSTVHPLNDNRIFHKQCKSLSRHGYDVTVIIAHHRNEVIDGVNVVGLPKPSNRFFRFFVLTFKVLMLAVKQKANVYHFHDPELISVGVILKMLGKKVIYDVHENIPQQVLNKDWLGPKWLRKIVSFLVIFSQKFCVKTFDKIIAARPDIAEHWSSGKVTVIMNSASLKTIDSVKEAEVEKNVPAIIYAGGLTRIRGIKELIMSMAFLQGRAELWLLGPWFDDNFKVECENLSGWKYVKYFGYCSVEEVFGFMKRSDIGVITFLPAPNHLTTIPTKPFEYMACRLPVVMSDFDYWREIFGESAVLVNPCSSQEIASQILKLLDDKDFAWKLACSGRRLVEEKYSWESEEKKLFEIYKVFESA